MQLFTAISHGHSHQPHSVCSTAKMRRELVTEPDTAFKTG